jgi:hypothetical protein
MRTYAPVLLCLGGLACSGGDPSPLEARPDLAIGPKRCQPTLAATPNSISLPQNTASEAAFLAKNNCTKSVSGWTLAASRTGVVTSVSAPVPATLPPLSPGQSTTVAVSFGVGSPGTGTIVLRATAVGTTQKPSATLTVTVTQVGLPFAVGPWYAPTQFLGATARWSGGQENGYAPGLKLMLDSLRASKARVVLSTLRGKMRNTDGTLSIDNFRVEIGKWAAAADVASYFSDGTIIAINVMDDNATGWTVPVTPAQVDSLAQIVKQTWPNAVVSTRTRPAQLGSYVFQYLDMAWAQYSGPYRDGPPQQYRDTQVADAKARGLGLVLTLNVLDGGCGSPTTACLSGIPGTDIWGTYENAASVRRYQVSAAELLEYGKIFIAEPYNCALLPWRYSATYARQSFMTDEQYFGIVNFDQRADVIDAWQQLVALGKGRAAGQCRRTAP